MMILIDRHVAAAPPHHFIHRDGLLRRMGCDPR
jgi:cytochrome b561